MEKHPLKNKTNQRLLLGFASWLNTLGYAAKTTYNLPRQLHEFLSWLETTQPSSDLKTLTAKDTAAFMDYFQHRPNQRRSGGLSVAHINKQLESLQKFHRYLQATQQGQLPVNMHKQKATPFPHRVVLSRAAIAALYAATDDSPKGQRDRVMLGIYYGCGLRKSEGLALELSDILPEKRLLYVRHSKNHHERYVPINEQVMTHLDHYLYHGRPLLLDETNKIESLFISERGLAMKGSSMIYRLNRLRSSSTQAELQNSFGLHALRHSIATHLLEAGMSLENIALFLGHKSLDSTQSYTHLKHTYDETHSKENGSFS